MARKLPVVSYQAQTRAPSFSPAIRSLTIVGILLVVVFAAFRNVCDNEFAGFDDPDTLYQNPRLHPAPPESVFHSALWYWKHAEFSLYVPVTYQVWAAIVPFAQIKNHQPSQPDLNAGVFHAASLGVHLLNVLAVYLLLRLLVQRDWAAGIGALAYGLHPLQVEPIAWASGLKDLLAGLGVMLALWQYLLYASADHEEFAARRFAHRWVHYALALISLVLAMLCKPSAMMMPVIAAILDWLIIGRPARKVAMSILPLCIAIAPLVIVAKLVQSGSPIDVVALWQRPFIATDALAFYLYKLAIPLQLAACYAHRPAAVIQHGWLWWTWIVPAAVAGAIWMAGKNRRWLFAVGLVMLAALAPVLGLTAFDYQRISTVADHYMYVALLGPALALAMALSHARLGWPRRIAISFAAMALLFYFTISTIQTAYWHDPLLLWSHAVAVAPESHTAHLNLGTTYDSLGPDALPLAYGEFSKAVELDGDDFNAQDNLASALVRLGRPEEAIEHSKRALEIQDRIGIDRNSPQFPRQLQERIGLAGVFLARHRPNEAAEFYESALRLDPHSIEAAQGLRAAREQMTPK